MGDQADFVGDPLQKLKSGVCYYLNLFFNRESRIWCSLLWRCNQRNSQSRNLIDWMISMYEESPGYASKTKQGGSETSIFYYCSSKCSNGFPSAGTQSTHAIGSDGPRIPTPATSNPQGGRVCVQYLCLALGIPAFVSLRLSQQRPVFLLSI